MDVDHPFTEVEARAAVFSMSSLFAPHPDGFSHNFYRRPRISVKDGVIALLNELHNGHASMECINRSFLVLLPKKPRALEMKDFKPICL